MRFNALTVKHLMDDLKLKQKDIAHKLSMSEAAFSAAMKRGGLSDDRMPILAKLLKVDTIDLLEPKDRVNIVTDTFTEYQKLDSNLSSEISHLKALLKAREESIENLHDTINILKKQLELLQRGNK